MTNHPRFAVLWRLKAEARQRVQVFATYESAYEYLCTLPAAIDCDWKYIEEIQPLTETRHVMQDGGSFFVFDAPETAESRSVESVWTFAEHIADGDVAAAARARAWFLETVAAGWFNVIWE